ncbi:MAG: PEP-CTERM sorting domain-containing protein [Armatimonadetes bacterium]|nr:PEP-CTERM sorting domain-containing protein [Armatimonadota bacterium]
MKVASIGALALLSSAAFATPVWYNGDDDEQGGYYAVQGVNGTNEEFIQYENFTWNSSENAGSIMGTMIASNLFSQVNWEIREGMNASTGDMGTLVASGTANANLIDLGDWMNTGVVDLYTMTADISPVALTNGGDYFLGMAVVSTSPAFVAALTTTSGANGVGSPVCDHVSSYVEVGLGLSAATHDVSMGIGTASPVPEPASFAVLGLGALVMLRRRKN